jgi:hypothetical protein
LGKDNLDKQLEVLDLIFNSYLAPRSLKTEVDRLLAPGMPIYGERLTALLRMRDLLASNKRRTKLLRRVEEALWMVVETNESATNNN